MTPRAAVAAVAVAVLAGCAQSSALVDNIEGVRLSADGRTLNVTVVHGRCEQGERRASVSESPTEVRVRVSGARSLPGECADVGLLDELTVRLEAPLADRRLVDDSDGRVLDAVPARLLPAPSTPSGRAVAEHGCPQTFDGVPAPPQGAVPDGRLVPDGEPAEALLCSYVGDNTVSSTGLPLSAEVLVELPAEELLAGLRAAEPVPEERFCTLIGGTEVNHLLRLRFADATVWVFTTDDPNSCSTTSNGAATLVTSVAPALTDLAGLPARHYR